MHSEREDIPRWWLQASRRAAPPRPLSRSLTGSRGEVAARGSPPMTVRSRHARRAGLWSRRGPFPSVAVCAEGPETCLCGLAWGCLPAVFADGADGEAINSLIPLIKDNLVGIFPPIFVAQGWNIYALMHLWQAFYLECALSASL